MNEITLSTAWTWLLGFMAVFITINQVLDIISKRVNAAKKPNTDQNARLTALEKRCDQYDLFFKSDRSRLDQNDEQSRLFLRSLLALMEHALDGNSIEQLERTKNDLQEYLIDKP